MLAFHQRVISVHAPTEYCIANAAVYHRHVLTHARVACSNAFAVLCYHVQTVG
jgi:hypothetical protein